VNVGCQQASFVIEADISRVSDLLHFNQFILCTHPHCYDITMILLLGDRKSTQTVRNIATTVHRN